MQTSMIPLWIVFFLTGIAFAYVIWWAAKYSRELRGFGNNKKEGRLENQ